MWDELLGGALIGLAAALLWLGIGRISGMTGVLSSLFMLTRPQQQRRSWSLWFLLGLVLAWPIFQLLGGDSPIHITRNPLLLAAAGLIVGFGTYVGNGCTSGHGVCGMGRLSVRSMVATVTFIAAGMVTVAVMNALGVSL